MNVFTLGVDARQKIVWLHDVPINMKFTEEESYTYDKVVVLSEYHKSLLPKGTPEEKIFVSSNGINAKDFKNIEEERDPHRMIYASSYDRGLEIIARNWGKIKKEVPQANLHIYYGWKVYDSLVQRGLAKDDGWKQEMVKLFQQDGIYEHGRIGHKELLKEYAKSGIYAYPTTYIGEIQCIAYTKAVACGCYPVTNDFAVLGERNKTGVVAPNEKYVDELIKTLKSKPQLKVDRQKYIKDHSWQKVAEQWQKHLLMQAS